MKRPSCPPRLPALIAWSLLAIACQSTAPPPAERPDEPASAPHALAAEGTRAADAPSPQREPSASDPAAQSAAPATAAEAAPPEPRGLVQLLSEMGVEFDRAHERLVVRGWVNMQEGLVEVFACAPEGKTHESVLVLDCLPSGLHGGLLALGLAAGQPVELGTGDEYRAPEGDRVRIRVAWTDEGGVEREARAEDWVWDDSRQDVMPPGGWIFAGSFWQPVSNDPSQSTYAANYVKSLVTTYHDASSILENPQLGGMDDTLYFANPRAVPAVGTPVRCIFEAAGEPREGGAR